MKWKWQLAESNANSNELCSYGFYFEHHHPLSVAANTTLFSCDSMCIVCDHCQCEKVVAFSAYRILNFMHILHTQTHFSQKDRRKNEIRLQSEKYNKCNDKIAGECIMGVINSFIFSWKFLFKKQRSEAKKEIKDMKSW